MSSVFDLERVHETYKNIIKNDWGLGDEAVSKYDTIRNNLESNATVTEFVPILTFRKIKEEYTRIGEE